MANFYVQVIDPYANFQDPAVRYNFTCTKKYDLGTSHYERLYNHIGISTATDIGAEISVFETMFDGDITTPTGLTNAELECDFNIMCL